MALVLLLTLIATSAQAGTPKELLGAWCLTQSVQNGHGEPRDNFYRREADCPAEDVVVFDRHSLKGLDYESDEGPDFLHVWGTPKPAKGKR